MAIEITRLDWRTVRIGGGTLQEWEVPRIRDIVERSATNSVHLDGLEGVSDAAVPELLRLIREKELTVAVPSRDLLRRLVEAGFEEGRDVGPIG